MKKIIFFIFLIIILSIGITINTDKEQTVSELENNQIINNEATISEQEIIIEENNNISVNKPNIIYKPIEYTSVGKYSNYNSFNTYDNYFRKGSKMSFGYGVIDWLWFKAQAIAESNIAYKGTNVDIISHAGAQGVMQIMPATWNELTKYNKYLIGKSVADPKYNIYAGINYDYKMFSIWKAKRPIEDKYCFMFASYNAGAGNIIKAQRYVLNNNPNLWKNVGEVLYKVTGNHSKETNDYVVRIFESKGDLITNEKYIN